MIDYLFHKVLLHYLNNKYKIVAIITIPGDWKRRYTKVYKKINYNGHYRDYGLDVTNLFNKYFKIVKVVNLFKYDGKKYGIKKFEPAFVCIK